MKNNCTITLLYSLPLKRKRAGTIPPFLMVQREGRVGGAYPTVLSDNAFFRGAEEEFWLPQHEQRWHEGA